MKWYLVNGKGDDYGACTIDLVKCNKRDLKYVYNYKEVPEEDVKVLEKYLDVVNDFIDEDQDLVEYLEENYG